MKYLKLIVKVWIHFLATAGCVASEYFYIVSIDVQFNNLIKFIIMVMIKRHKNIEI
jgi:hypothetical protein